MRTSSQHFKCQDMKILFAQTQTHTHKEECEMKNVENADEQKVTEGVSSKDGSLCQSNC